MHRVETLFTKARESAMFGPLHDGPISELELYLRFEHAVQNFVAHLNREYCHGKMHFNSVAKLPEASRFDFYFPRRGKAMLITTEIQTEVIPISSRIRFESDPLYEKFKAALDNPVKSFEFMVESDYMIEDDHENFIHIFRNAYNDPRWMHQMARHDFDYKPDVSPRLPLPNAKRKRK